jgi:hypothetical protein
MSVCLFKFTYYVSYITKITEHTTDTSLATRSKWVLETLLLLAEDVEMSILG